jgi:RimJ/RimL family protein N-acetyltransferase
VIQFQPIDPTYEEAQHLWTQIQGVAAWALDDSSQFADLVTGLGNSNAKYFHIVEKGERVGYCSLTGIVPGREAYAHTLFFDRKVIGRGTRLNKLTLRLMETYQLPVVRSIVPVSHKATRLLLQRMGWSEDGVIRQYMYRNGGSLDGILFTVTQEELRNGRPIRRNQAKIQDQIQNGSAHRGDSGAPVADVVATAHAEWGPSTNVCGISWHG